jgi:alpha-glucosidase
MKNKFRSKSLNLAGVHGRLRIVILNEVGGLKQYVKSIAFRSLGKPQDDNKKHFCSYSGILSYTRLAVIGAFFLLSGCNVVNNSLYVESKDGLNKITLSLNANGELFYNVTRRDSILIADSPLGLNCEDQDFTTALSIDEISPVEETRENYTLKVGNYKNIDHVFNRKSITFKNSSGASMILDLVAGEEGVAFRYRFPDENGKSRTIKEEITGFQIDPQAKGWL